jgi:phosphotriesterase-related protein
LKAEAREAGVIQTVTGPLEPSALGPTLMHEHLLCDITPPALAARGVPDVPITLENCWSIRHHWCRDMGNNRLDEEDVAVAELGHFRAAGGHAVVELTVAGIAPDPVALRRVSEASGVAVVAGCGHYTADYLTPETARRGVDQLAGEIIAALTVGIAGTDVRAGIIGEVGCSDHWGELERRTMRAAVLAQAHTGASITVHPGRRAGAPGEIVDFVAAHGGDVSRCVIGHIDRTIFDDDTLFALADRGCVIEYDFFGIESSYYPFQDIDLPNDAMRLKAIRKLVDRGHLHQVLISQDICTKTRLRHYGGHGYAHLLENVVPVMGRRGFTPDEIRTILTMTPRRLLTIQAV